MMALWKLVSICASVTQAVNITPTELRKILQKKMGTRFEQEDPQMYMVVLAELLDIPLSKAVEEEPWRARGSSGEDIVTGFFNVVASAIISTFSGHFLFKAKFNKTKLINTN